MTLPYGEQFNLALRLILESEGGYVNDPDDPGGATNRGITQRTLDQLKRRGVWSGYLPDSVRELSIGQTADIYCEEYWKKVAEEQWPLALNLIIFDHAVNGGTGSAIRCLQDAAGTKPDGIVGPITIARVDHALSRGGTDLYGKMLAGRLEKIARSSLHSKFYFGLFRRIVGLALLTGRSDEALARVLALIPLPEDDARGED